MMSGDSGSSMQVILNDFRVAPYSGHNIRGPRIAKLFIVVHINMEGALNQYQPDRLSYESALIPIPA